MTIDPVCGMTVDPAKARGGSFEHAGHDLLLLLARMPHQIRRRPRRLAPARTEGNGRFDNSQLTTQQLGEAAARSDAGPDRADPDQGLRTDWTCPMHPEIVQPTPATVRSAAWRSSP